MSLILLFVSGIFRFFEFSQSWLKRGAKYGIIVAFIPIVVSAIKYLSFSVNIVTSNNIFGELLWLVKSYAPDAWDYITRNQDMAEMFSFMFYICGGEILVWSWFVVMVPILAVLIVIKAVILIVNIVAKVFA